MIELTTQLHLFFHTTGSGETATIPSNVSDYNTIKSFTAYDEDAIIKSNINVEGDVIITIFHARQTIGSFLSSNKFEGLLIAKLYFHTGFLSTNTSCIKVKLKDLDGVITDANGVKDQRFPSNFKVVVNFRPEKEIRKIDIVKSPSKDLGLIFTSQAEHESNHSMMQFSGSTTSNCSNDSPLTEDISMPPNVPPRLKKNISLEKSSRSTTPTSIKSTSVEAGLKIEDLISPVVDLPPEIFTNISNNSKPTKTEQILIDTNSPESAKPSDCSDNLQTGQIPKIQKETGDLVRPASDTLLLDLEFGSNLNTKEKSPHHQSQHEVGEKGAIPNSGVAVNDLLGITEGNSSTVSSTNLVRSSVKCELDLFGPDPTSSNSTIIGNVGSSIKPSNSAADLFMMTDTRPINPSPQTNLLGDFGDFSSSPITNPPTTAQKNSSILNPSGKSVSTTDELIDNLLSGLDVNQPENANASVQNNHPKYSRDFFTEQPKPQTVVPQMSSKKIAPNTFNDLLGGFEATSQATNETKTIGEMKKKEEMKQMTPLEAKVFAWKDGKSRNLRALLCSLDKILWEGARWQQCGMHQLVTDNDVNKMYKKAILAVHPDRQMGTQNEELATLLQKELNDAWAEYKTEI